MSLFPLLSVTSVIIVDDETDDDDDEEQEDEDEEEEGAMMVSVTEGLLCLAVNHERTAHSAKSTVYRPQS